MRTSASIIFVVVFVNSCIAQAAFDNCAADIPREDKRRCKAKGNKEKCYQLGCYFCPSSGKPKCVEGQACQRWNLKEEDNCWKDETGPVDPVKCNDKEGCSYCKYHVQYQCIRDGPVIKLSSENCDLEGAERTKWRCGFDSNRTRCALDGCHYCKQSKPRCLYGAACRRNDITAEDNCWPSTNTKEPNPKDCLNIYGCSWCKDSNPKCVRDKTSCGNTEALHCYPTSHVTQSKCNEDKDCQWCNQQSQCIRGICPAGYKLRYGQDSCCKDDDHTKIVGGSQSLDGAWPWMAMLLDEDEEQFCGGTLVGHKYVLSAAHCIKEQVSVLLGANKLNEPHGKIVKVAEIHDHPNYNNDLTGHDHDIMMLILEESVTFTDKIMPLSLPMGESPIRGQKCIVAGWGDTEEGANEVVEYLREVGIYIQSTEGCEDAYIQEEQDRQTHGSFDDRIMFCAGVVGGDFDSCQGDSGGPVMCQRCESCEWYLAGIVAGGIGCAREEYFGIYTKVQGYSAWISEYISHVDKYKCEI